MKEQASICRRPPSKREALPTKTRKNHSHTAGDRLLALTTLVMLVDGRHFNFRRHPSNYHRPNPKLKG